MNDLLRRDRWHAKLDQQGYNDERLAIVDTVMNAGMVLILHTWGQKMELHAHVHIIMTVVQYQRQDAVDQYRLDASSPAERYRQLPPSEYTGPEYDGSKRVSNYLSGYVISAGSYYRGEPSALAAGFDVVGVQNQ